ncbi:beta-N-acetylhexosaminidase [Gemmatimonas sp.]|uniref:beta-N-acetylhexosaminidase n=1 Tax=Gemmatimonas sp. TaxID=1962908 RepID=UPI00286DC060|nr:beta-N-acetylhexosaminidase [Gemmatimonas sp.]
MRHLILAALVALPTTGAATARAMPADSSTYAIIPRPVVLTPKSGAFTLTARTVVHADPAFTGVARRFARDVADPTGFDLTVVRRATAGSAVAGGIALIRTPALGPEAYTLDVTPAGVVIKASAPAGAFYGLETLKQLLPAAIYREAPLGNTMWRAAAVHVEDAPRFAWRGSHLDVARHFESKEFVKKYIDLLARHKMNRFHWHLTEDQGWRIEIKKYPLLTELGSCREQTLVGPYITNPKPSNFDGKRHCGFYTQDDVREVVAYAADRMITVVPEIEMPGHAQAAIHAYPQLSSRPDSSPGVMQVWGVSDFILNPTDSTVAFMQDVLTEVLALFPGPYIHIGGDEAGKAQWKANPQIQARIKALGLKDEHEMQSWFIRQMDTFLTARGRRMIGWDEILEGGLAENATVMSWRGMAGGIAAAKANHDVVMAPGSHTYFDHYQSRDKAKEPLAIGGFTPIDSVYAFEPVPPQLTADEAKHVLGAQAQLWAEYMPNAKHVEYMAYPRMVALSEVLWSAKVRRDFANFKSRLPTHLARLDALDVNYRRQ